MRLHHGTAQFVARLTLARRARARGGRGGAGGRAARRRCRRRAARPLHPPRPLAGGDVGGGRVLDAGGRRWRGREAHAAVPARPRRRRRRRGADRARRRERATPAWTEDAAAGAGVDRGDGARRARAGSRRPARVESLTGGAQARWFAAGTLGARPGRAGRARPPPTRAARPERPFSAAGGAGGGGPGPLAGGRVDAARRTGVGRPACWPPKAATRRPAPRACSRPPRRRPRRTCCARLRAEPFAPPTLATLAEQTGVAGEGPRPPARGARPARRPRPRRQGPLVLRAGGRRGPRAPRGRARRRRSGRRWPASATCSRADAATPRRCSSCSTARA